MTGLIKWFMTWLETTNPVEAICAFIHPLIREHWNDEEPLTVPKSDIPVKPLETPPSAPQPYKWGSREEIRHSMRLIADEERLTYLQKDMLCDIGWCESRYVLTAKLVNSPNSVDRGLFQWNNYWHPEITDAIAYDPEKATRLACKAIKQGKAMAYWSASARCWNATGKYFPLGDKLGGVQNAVLSLKGMKINPALEGFLRGVGLVVLTAIVSYLTDASHLAFINNPLVVTLIIGLAASFENHLKDNGAGALFGAVRPR